MGLPYELKFVSGDVSGSLRALAKAHVMRMAPILEDGAVKMVESGAILEYILVRYGGGRLQPPPDSCLYRKLDSAISVVKAAEDGL